MVGFMLSSCAHEKVTHLTGWLVPWGCLSVIFLYCGRRKKTRSLDLGMPVETLTRPRFLLFFLPGRWWSSDCPSRVLNAVVSGRTRAPCLTVPSPAVLVRQATRTLPEAAGCYENLCHRNRNKTRTLADTSASNFSNLWNTIASAQPCDWEEIPACRPSGKNDPAARWMAPCPGASSRSASSLISKTPTPMYSDMAV